MCSLACSSNSQPVKIIEKDCCTASTAIIFWKCDSTFAEKDLKSILKDLKIEFKDLSTQEFNIKTRTIDGIRDSRLSRLSHHNNSWSSLSLCVGSLLTDKICQKLSSNSKSPVIAFLEYDESAWGYCLFQNGKLTDSFWNDHEVVERTISECASNINIISEAFHVSKSEIEPYLVDISGKQNLGKINPDDEFELEDIWVRVDFMKQLGLTYPEREKWIYIEE